jgi:hypothetical protein
VTDNSLLASISARLFVSKHQLPGGRLIRISLSPLDAMVPADLAQASRYIFLSLDVFDMFYAYLNALSRVILLM